MEGASPVYLYENLQWSEIDWMSTSVHCPEYCQRHSLYLGSSSTVDLSHSRVSPRRIWIFAQPPDILRNIQCVPDLQPTAILPLSDIESRNRPTTRSPLRAAQCGTLRAPFISIALRGTRLCLWEWPHQLSICPFLISVWETFNPASTCWSTR